MSSSNATGQSKKGSILDDYRPNCAATAASTSPSSKPEPSLVPDSYYDTYRPKNDKAAGASGKTNSLADELGLSKDGPYFNKETGYRPRTEEEIPDTQEVKHQMITSESVDGRDGSNYDPDEAEGESKKKQVVYR
ncbi:hypothetical protein HBI23_230550 [Parastagonospora nodorum]|nr:hypothetical protein HBH42_119920 [Parastagonospora nodorum]KAH5430975.1 hypothetical protein HBI47_110580 [Parastagonospora nodorum]KAH5625852.1 hypothetical protein HBI23_230550 [Parastagonospora nodorum]KAH6346031.1 hypothetical protein HBI37_078640 [Parastagonospora nodorum]KAH6352154.1 hypothetical protein HBI36_110910 [Parastagonospora nodorum]